MRACDLSLEQGECQKAQQVDLVAIQREVRTKKERRKSEG